MLLSEDVGTTKQVIYHDGAYDGEFHIEERQDVQPIIDQNHADQVRYDELHLSGKLGDRLAARIPPVIWNKLWREGITKDPKRLAAWLNDPDNAAFRVWKGRV